MLFKCLDLNKELFKLVDKYYHRINIFDSFIKTTGNIVRKMKILIGAIIVIKMVNFRTYQYLLGYLIKKKI